MRFAFTERFKQAYRELQPQDQALADKALRLLSENMRHPSLHVKGIKGTDKIWEARVTRSIRLTFEVQRDLLLLRNIGKHDETLKHP